jgi:hypothetical protein
MHHISLRSGSPIFSTVSEARALAQKLGPDFDRAFVDQEIKEHDRVTLPT